MLGEVIVEYLIDLHRAGDIPHNKTCGIILAGDYWSRPDRKMKGKGYVAHIWRELAQRFRWAIGVAGNHDFFGKLTEFQELNSTRYNLKILDDACKKIDGIMIAGISGVVGNVNKSFNRTMDEYVQTVTRLVNINPDILVMHDGPDYMAYPGQPYIREALRGSESLIIRGHKHWNEPLQTIEGGPQVLNVNGRIVILKTDWS